MSGTSYGPGQPRISNGSNPILIADPFLPPSPKRELGTWFYPDWRRHASRLAAVPQYLDAWERGFVVSLQGFTRISPKQAERLGKIAARVLRDR